MSSPICPSVAVVVDHLPPWLVANFNAASANLDFTVIEISPRADQAYSGVGFRIEKQNDLAKHEVATWRFVQMTLDKLQPDAVLTLGWNGGKNLAVLHWALCSGMPAIVASDSKADDFTRNALREHLKARVLNLYSAAWAASRQSAEYLEHLGVSHDRIVIGPVDTIDIDHFTNGAAAARDDAGRLRAKLALPENFFIAVSRLSPEKNLSALVRAYARYRKRAGVAAWHLVIVGEGPSRGEIEAQIAASDVAAAVRLIGWVGFDQMPTYYGLASGFILASSKDTWGCVVNEAAAASLPLLVSRKAGSAPELVEEHRNGWTFNPNDEAEIAALLTALAEPSRDRIGMGEISRGIIARWSPESYGASLRNVVEVALRQPPRRSTPIERAVLRCAALAQLRRETTGARSSQSTREIYR